MESTAAVALARAASTIYAAARAHKRAEFAHRKQARELMAELERVKQACAAAGIQIEITETPQKEGHSA